LASRNIAVFAVKVVSLEILNVVKFSFVCGISTSWVDAVKILLFSHS
jgi:hypothetical protein